MALYIGIMSGTSLDGIDISLVEISPQSIRQLACHYLTYPQQLRQQLLELCSPADNELQRLGVVEQDWARLAACAVNSLLTEQNLSAADIAAIGSHGQTIRHHPESGFSIQIGAPALLAELTGISVVSHFRQRDLAAGGQGAPLVPAFHQWLFQHRGISQAIVNIGGFSNVSFVSSQQPTTGFDCGPGNVLLDAWINLHKQQAYDNNGDWAASGKVDRQLLAQMLQNEFFQQQGPKSTGRELFNLAWLQRQIHAYTRVAAQDIQCTLAELTAHSISTAIKNHACTVKELWLCGGGAHNQHLRRRLAALLPDVKVGTTDEIGVNPDWMEAMAFAWLAYMCLQGKSASLPLVTGARGERILGAIYPA